MNLPDSPTFERLQAPFECSILNRATWIHYSKCLDKLVEYFGKQKDPGTITRAEVEEWMNWIRTQHTEVTSKKFRTAAKSFYNWMILKEVPGVFVNPFEKLKPLKLPQKSFPAQLRT